MPLAPMLLLFAAAVSAQTYEIRPAPDSRFAFEVFKTGLLGGKKHLFLFERYSGTLRHDAAAPEKSSVDLTVDVASLVCKDTWIDEKDLKKVMAEAFAAHMLDPGKHPTIRFVSKSVARRAEGGFDVQGTLTIKGQDLPSTVAVTLESRPDGTLRLAGKSEVRLKDYGLKPPSAALGAIGTKNEMAVDFSVTAWRK